MTTISAACHAPIHARARQHYFNEIDPEACATLRLEMSRGRLPQGTIDSRSIADVRPADLVGYRQCDFFAGIGGAGYARVLAGWPDELELWTGGFPCQDISVAGKGAGLEGSRSGLWWEWFRLIEACRPARLCIENVPALRTRGADAVLDALEGVGYACRALVVGAEHVGAPHRRHRVWIVASRDVVGCGAFGAKPAGQQRQASPFNGGGDVADRNSVGLRKHCIGGVLDGQRQASGDDVDGRGEREVSQPAAGEELFDSPRGGQRADGSAQRDAGHADECEQAVVHPAIARLEGHGPDTGQPQGCESGSAGASGGTVVNAEISRLEGQRERSIGTRPELSGSASTSGSRWPMPPGPEQHGWEPPRLVAFPNSRAGNGKRNERDNGDQLGDGNAGKETQLCGAPQRQLGGNAHGLPGGLGLARLNKARLKQFGNSWAPQVAAAILGAWLAANTGQQ